MLSHVVDQLLWGVCGTLLVRPPSKSDALCKCKMALQKPTHLHIYEAATLLLLLLLLFRQGLDSISRKAAPQRRQPTPAHASGNARVTR